MFCNEAYFAAKKASEKVQNLWDSLKLVYSTRIASDTHTNYISAKFYNASPSVSKMCDLWLLLRHHESW